MKRVFKIGEVVFFEDDHESGWGRIVLINRTDKWKEDICGDDAGDILTIRKEGCRSEIETTPSRVYQVAQDRFFRGEPVCWEHNEGIDYPFFCPGENENCYHFEVEEISDEA